MTSVYVYLQVCTVQLYRHIIIDAGARWVSHGDSVGVVQTSV